MMRRLQARAEQLAQAERRRQAARIAARWKEQVRGLRIDHEGSTIAVSGRGLFHRWLVDPTLRFIGGGTA